MATKIFEGLGPSTLIPQRGKLPLDDPRLGPEEGFVMSRVDGRTSLEEICLLVPFDAQVTMLMLRRLWEIGAIEVPGVPRELRARRLTPPPPAEPETVEEPTHAPVEPVDAVIPAEQRARIDAFYADLERRDAFELLEVDRSVDEKGVKRAYFKLSKEFHPDRYFGRDIGPYKEKLTKIFQAVKAAFEVLSHKERRAAYEESVASQSRR